ncbi:MAG: hypothetical protein ACK5AZ_23125 [Bryobacteraceae bacterium]
MQHLAFISDLLTELAGQLHLAEDRPLVFDDLRMLDTGKDLIEFLESDFPDRPLVAEGCVLVDLLTTELQQTTPAGQARFIRQFSRLVTSLIDEMRDWKSVEAHVSAFELAELAASAENLAEERDDLGFFEFSRDLARIKKVREACRALPVEVRNDDFANNSVFRRATESWIEDTALDAAAYLFHTLAQLQPAIEARARQSWFVARREYAEDPGMADLYVWAWRDVLPPLQLTPGRLNAMLVRTASVCERLRLEDMAPVAHQPQALLHYGLNYLLPPAPDAWTIQSVPDLRRLLSGQISRWYFCPFEHELRPLEATAAVLRLQRPLLYEKVVAHAMLQYAIFQSLPLSRELGPIQLELMAELETNFELLLDGYLLRVAYMAKLATPADWRSYIDALLNLHFHGQRAPIVTEARTLYLRERGLPESRAILEEMTREVVTVN